jgi:hypothetical protein
MQRLKCQFGISFPDKAQKRGLNIPAIREKLRIMCTFIPVITKLAAISTEIGIKYLKQLIGPNENRIFIRQE